jgi:hypothetical protein
VTQYTVAQARFEFGLVGWDVNPVFSKIVCFVHAPVSNGTKYVPPKSCSVPQLPKSGVPFLALAPCEHKRVGHGRWKQRTFQCLRGLHVSGRSAIMWLGAILIRTQ